MTSLTTSPVRIASRVSATTQSKSRVNAVIKYTCECTITSKIRAGCEIGRANISCWCEWLFRKYELKTMGQSGWNTLYRPKESLLQRLSLDPWTVSYQHLLPSHHYLVWRLLPHKVSSLKTPPCPQTPHSSLNSSLLLHILYSRLHNFTSHSGLRFRNVFTTA